MQFWQDASPAVKGVVVVGTLGILYLSIGYFAGLWPWAAGCNPACESGTVCHDGECVQDSRGFEAG